MKENMKDLEKRLLLSSKNKTYWESPELRRERQLKLLNIFPWERKNWNNKDDVYWEKLIL